MEQQSELILRYEVQGMGDFPWDMLRYDRVWPLSTPVPHRTESNEAWGKTRRVVVVGHGCTPARWTSFGWSIMGEIVADAGIPTVNPDLLRSLYGQ